MSIAGFKKQVNKANQFVSEKIGGVKGTDTEEEFNEKEKKTECLAKLVHEMNQKIHEMLQPNPASRVKMIATKSLSKLKGNSQPNYPQSESALADVLIKYGPEFGNQSLYGRSLIQTAEAFQAIADARYCLEEEVNQTFIEPLYQIEHKDMKELNFHRKKMEGRRLDYDCKKRKKSKGANITDTEVDMAKDKYEESKCIVDSSMTHLLDNDTEHISHLMTLLTSLLKLHKRSSSIIESLLSSLSQKKQIAERKRESVSKMTSSVVQACIFKLPPVNTRLSNSFTNGVNYTTTVPTTATTYSLNLKRSQHNIDSMLQNLDVKVEAIYDFKAEAENELSLETGCIVHNVSRIDDSWLQGTYNNKSGYFPITYIKVISGSLC